MVGVVIIAILFAVGIPSMMDYMTNSRILATAQSFQASVQQARTQAILLNSNVDIILTNVPAVAGNVGVGSLSVTGPNWIIQVQPNANATPTPFVQTAAYTFIDGKTNTEDGGITGSAGVAMTANQTAGITFTGLSSRVAFAPEATPALATFDFRATTASGKACALASGAGGPIRCLRVVVFPGGRSKVCDPAATTAVGDTRSCT